MADLKRTPLEIGAEVLADVVMLTTWGIAGARVFVFVLLDASG